jgi:hypothetical protein
MSLRDVIAGVMRDRGVAFTNVPKNKPVKAPPPADDDEDSNMKGIPGASPDDSEFYAGEIKSRDRMTAVRQTVRAARKAQEEEALTEEAPGRFVAKEDDDA